MRAPSKFLCYCKPAGLGLQGGSSTLATTWPAALSQKARGSEPRTGESMLQPAQAAEKQAQTEAAKTANSFLTLGPLESINPAIRRRLEVAVR